MLILMRLKKVGTESAVPVLVLNGKWTSGNAYMNINASMPNSFFQNFAAHVYAKDGNVFMNTIHNDGINIIVNNSSYKKITSVEIEKTGIPNYAIGSEVYIYAR